MTTERTRRRTAEERREAILQTAATLFFEQGYGATCIDCIIERIGGSKRDIYAQFGNKEGILDALVKQTSQTLMDTLDAAEESSADLRETLRRFGRKLLGMYAIQGTFNVYHTVVAEALRFPDLAQTFYDHGPARTTAKLAKILDDAKSRGEINITSGDSAAALFVGMFRGDLHFQIVLGRRLPPDEKEIDQIVTTAVDIFLNGTRPRTGAACPDEGRAL